MVLNKKTKQNSGFGRFGFPHIKNKLSCVYYWIQTWDTDPNNYFKKPRRYKRVLNQKKKRKPKYNEIYLISKLFLLKVLKNWLIAFDF